MKKAKRSRLERAGWRAGTAREFLGLSDEESQLLDLKLTLARALRQKRERAGLSQTALAKLIESSQSRVAKIEAGDRSVTLDLIVRSLLAMGASPRELGRIILNAKKAA